MITERDEIKCKTSLEMIDASSLEPRTKADLKESIEEAKMNLNGRNIEERVLSIAQNQFDTTRFLAEIIIQFKQVADKVGGLVKDAEPAKEEGTGKKSMVKTALRWISENQFFVLLVVIIIAIQGGNIGTYIAKLLGM